MKVGAGLNVSVGVSVRVIMTMNVSNSVVISAMWV